MMKKKIFVVLFLAVHVSHVVSAPVQDEQVTLLAKQKREFVRGVRGIRHIFSKDTITAEEKAALKSLMKKGAILAATLAGIAVAGYLGKKYWDKKVSLDIESDGPAMVTLCGESVEIRLPEFVGDKKKMMNQKINCSSSVTVKRMEDPLRFVVTIRTYKATAEERINAFSAIRKAIRNEYPIATIETRLYQDSSDELHMIQIDVAPGKLFL